MSCGENLVGWIVGESSPARSLVIFSHDSKSNLSAGMYLVTETPKGCVLGILESLVSGSRLLPNSVTDPNSVNSVISAINQNEMLGETYLKGNVMWLSYLDALKNGSIDSPKVPPFPGTIVYSAKKEDLENIFSPNEKGWIKIGKLSTIDVDYKININKLQRHLAILAVTGGGKSNTVCILSRNIIKELDGTVVLFDMHGEYGDLGLGDKANIRKPIINPAKLSFEEIKDLSRLPENAINQERILRRAWLKTMDEYKKGQISAADFMEKLYENAKEEKGDANKREVDGALNKLEDIKSMYDEVIDPNAPLELKEIIEPGKLTIFDLSELDEIGADAIVSHFLRRLLQERKLWKRTKSGNATGYPVPAFTVIEEAHILIPNKRNTLTSYWASRIAREGRKFGVGLILVSQRPKNVNPDVLSQTNNKIILKIVEPQDIEYVQDASEELSQDLADLLPGLNPGEAIIIGSMAKLPALVKIELCNSKKSGGDIDIVSEWSNINKSNESIDEDLKSVF
ncbi:putative ATPase [Caldisphaera lagunensis DSM 15908]|uniref:Putative ATPase n=1 Tax=Caldisphaera lagunensis (strain DSM 15908 / JCM 11604 / ANMR 0165 / IC-154) TaxID=1056495 RepID=L0AAB3_CALLD|nr:ATP-binding protein [Caldisphaera lagunensis]AFZ70364.1 putative ATPase [Caldisphaera lagunensis DSM 15908]